jgi:hypothetical protein
MASGHSSGEPVPPPLERTEHAVVRKEVWKRTVAHRSPVARKNTPVIISTAVRKRITEGVMNGGLSAMWCTGLGWNPKVICSRSAPIPP